MDEHWSKWLVQYLGVEVVVEVVPQQAVDQHRLTLKVVPTTKSVI